MEVSVLASGSSGNSTFIESKNARILVDAGVSAKSISKRLSSIGKSISELDAVFITHEHIDHIRGAETLNRKFEIPIYLNKPTYEFSSLEINKPNFFANGDEVEFNGMRILPFSTNHDAADPCGFRIEENSSVIGVMTDFGKADNAMKLLTKDANALVLESNHDIDMLINGPYPEHLKQRILGEKGHLSNADAGLLVRDNASDKLKTVFLAHLSKNNNTEELAMDTFEQLTCRNKNLNMKRILAKQEENTELIKI